MISFRELFKKKETKKDLIKDENIATTRKVPLETLKARRLAKVSLDQCSDWIEKFGPRKTGSKACMDTASEIEKNLKKYCDHSEKQEFENKAKSYGFWLKLLPFVYILGLILLLFGFPVTSILLYGAFLFYIYSGFIKYTPIGEKYFTSDKGCNVHGTIEPSGKVEHTIIFSSHHDSAVLPSYERHNTKDYFLKVNLPLILFGSSAICIVVQLIVEIFTGRLFNVGFPPITSIVFILILLALSTFVFSLQNYFSNEASLGAGDNLISCTTILQIARYFSWKKENGESLEKTRIIFCSFDGEEVGLKGSKEWFSKNSSLLKNAMQINFDCLYHSDQLVFIDSDINGTQQLSSKLAEKGVKLAVAMGYKAKMHPMPFLSGGTDAAEGYRAGIDAVSLMALDFNNIREAYFHTSNDTTDKIQVKAIEQVISIAIKMANVVDIDKFEDEDLIIEEKEILTEENKPDLKFNKITRR